MHGYGVMSYRNGDRYEGMMKDNHRFGPGMYFHADSTKVNVGLWMGMSLFRLCYEIPCLFSLSNYNHLCASESGWTLPDKICLADDLTDQLSAIRPILQSMQGYRGSVDVNKIVSKVFMAHSLTDNSLAFDRKQFDVEFYGGYENFNKILSKGSDSWIVPKNATDAIVTMLRLAHHFQGRESLLSFNPNAIFTATTRIEATGSDFDLGTLEEMSEKYIRSASSGDVNAVLDFILDDELAIHPDVSDCRGNGALINAVISGHLEMVDTLLNNGCNSNLINDDGVTPLLACFTIFYPSSCFLPNLAENPPGIDKYSPSAPLLKKLTKKESTHSRSRSTSPKKGRSSPNKKRKSPSPKLSFDGDVETIVKPKSALKKEEGNKEPKNITFDSPPQTPSLEPMAADNIDSQQSIPNLPLTDLPENVLERAATLLSANEYVTSKRSGGTSKEDKVRERAVEIAQYVFILLLIH